MKNFTCISVNHKLCGQAFRSLFTFDSAQCEKLLFDVKDLSPVLICTCNRTELYFCGTPEEGIRLLCKQSGVEIAKLKRKVMIFTDKTAVKRLYSVPAAWRRSRPRNASQCNRRQSRCCRSAPRRARRSTRSPRHVDATGSEKGKRILDNFEEYLPKFKKIIPHDYKKMMSAIASMEEKGMSSDQAQIEAFYQIINGKQ